MSDETIALQKQIKDILARYKILVSALKEIEGLSATGAGKRIAYKALCEVGAN